jgi:hypothetical protein
MNANGTEIQSDVPMPETAGQSGRGTRTVNPWRELEVGQSFLLAALPLDISREGSLRTRVWWWSKKLGRKFAARKTEEGLRVWRTA